MCLCVSVCEGGSTVTVSVENENLLAQGESEMKKENVERFSIVGRHI